MFKKKLFIKYFFKKYCKWFKKKFKIFYNGLFFFFEKIAFYIKQNTIKRNGVLMLFDFDRPTSRLTQSLFYKWKTKPKVQTERTPNAFQLWQAKVKAYTGPIEEVNDKAKGKTCSHGQSYASIHAMLSGTWLCWSMCQNTLFFLPYSILYDWRRRWQKYNKEQKKSHVQPPKWQMPWSLKQFLDRNHLGTGKYL